MNGVDSSIGAWKQHLGSNQLLHSLEQHPRNEKPSKNPSNRKWLVENLIYHDDSVFAFDGNDGAAIVDGFGGIFDLENAAVR